MAGDLVGAPTGAKITEAITVDVSALVAGLTEGMIVKVAPAMGTGAPILTWAALLGMPVIGALGALFTRGMMGDLFTGMAAGGLGVLGFSLPSMLAPAEGAARQIGAGQGVKALPPGISGALRAQQTVAQVPRQKTWQ